MDAENTSRGVDGRRKYLNGCESTSEDIYGKPEDLFGGDMDAGSARKGVGWRERCRSVDRLNRDP